MLAVVLDLHLLLRILGVLVGVWALLATVAWVLFIRASRSFSPFR